MSLNHKIEWKYKNKLISVVIKNDGEVFGGAVRDKYLHDIHARNFYEQFAKDGICYHMKDIYYSNKSYHPEFFGRWIIPNDIDAYIHVSKLDNLVKKLSSFGQVIKVFSHDPSQYLQNIVLNENEVKHNCYKIYPSIGIDIQYILASMADHHCNVEKLKELIALANTEFEIKLDLIVYMKENNKNFNNLDFECNGLIMNNKSIKLCDHLLAVRQINKYDVVEVMEYTMKVLNDIKNRKAIYCNQSSNQNIFPIERINKMTLKEWTVLGFFKKIEIIDNDPEYEGHCLMCHDALPKVMLKFTCCDARYHPKCMIQALDVGNTAIVATEKCLMCKKDLINIYRDRAMLEHYIKFAPLYDWWPSSHEPEQDQEQDQEPQLLYPDQHENANIREILALQAGLDQRISVRTAASQAAQATSRSSTSN